MHLDSLLFEKISKKDLNIDEMLNFVFTQTEKMQNTGQKQLAILYYQQALKIIPDNYEIYENLALIYHSNDNYTVAKEIYDFALEKFGNNQSLLLGRGLLYIQIGDTIKACQDLNLSSQLGNKEAKILFSFFFISKIDFILTNFWIIFFFFGYDISLFILICYSINIITFAF